MKPGSENPNSIPAFTEAINNVNLGQAATPAVPGFIAQANAGWIEGTFNSPPGIGGGDGVMVAGDVRTLARQYCTTSNKSIKYEQYNLLSHQSAVLYWAPRDRLDRRPLRRPDRPHQLRQHPRWQLAGAGAADRHGLTRLDGGSAAPRVMGPHC